MEVVAGEDLCLLPAVRSLPGKAEVTTSQWEMEDEDVFGTNVGSCSHDSWVTPPLSERQLILCDLIKFLHHISSDLLFLNLYYSIFLFLSVPSPVCLSFPQPCVAPSLSHLSFYVVSSHFASSAFFPDPLLFSP